MTKRLTITLLLIAMLANFGFGFAKGISRPMTSDSLCFLKIACSVAGGDGYWLREGFWPATPTMTRSPAWPLTVSVALRTVPYARPDVTMRVLCLLLNALNAVLLSALAFRALGQVPKIAAITGILYAIHPTALFFAYEGSSEILFLTLTTSGILLLMSGEMRRIIGFLLLGFAALTRPNFVLWLPFVAFLVLGLGVRCRNLLTRRNFLLFTLGSFLFAAPSLLWAIRNYTVCGRFPVLNTLSGQTFYGGNNPSVADTLEYWGYWIFPDNIPGEKSMFEMSKTMNEEQVDRYYSAKGKEYIRTHWFAMPRLLLGKLIRAYVPIPWQPGWLVYGASAFRWPLYVMFIIGICAFWRDVRPAYRVILAAMTLTNIVTVLIFWGYVRFAFAIEPYFLPVIAIVVGKAISRE